MRETTTIEFAPVEHTTSGIWVGHAALLDTKLRDMNKRLAKLGAPAATLTFGPEVERTLIDDGHVVARWTEWEFVTVTGYSAKISGWTPVASLDHTFVTPDGDGEAWVSLFPLAIENEVELPAEFRTIGRGCDHCGTNRRRKTTVVFRSDDGDWINVGTSCLRDFIGITPATITWLSSFLRDFDDDEFRTPPEAYEPDLTYVLKIAAAVTDSSGFVRSAEPGSTRATIEDFVRKGDFPRNRYGSYTNGAWHDIDWDAAAAKAEAIKTWVLAKADAGGGDYIANAALAVRANRAAGRSMGLLASLPFSYNRAMAIVTEREAKLAARPDTIDEHVGAVGDKLVLRPVAIVKAIRVDTMYGTSVRVTGIDADGHKVTTFGSGDTLFGVEVDDLVEWRGTVKALNASDEYGVETEFARVKLLDLPSDVDFTKVAKPGDTVKVAVGDESAKAHDLRFPREVPDGWLYAAETGTLYARVDKVRKADDRFVYTTNAPTGFFHGAEVEVVDAADWPDPLDAWRMTDIDIVRELRSWSAINRDEIDRDVMVRKLRRWYEARGVEIDDEFAAAEIDRFDALTEAAA